MNDAISAIEFIHKPGRRFKLAELQNSVIAVVGGKKHLLKEVAVIEVTFENKAAASDTSPKLMRDGKGRPGLQLTEAHVNGLGIKVAAAQEVKKPQPLPAQVGTVNFDDERLFNIRTYFDGEVVEMGQVDEAPDPGKPGAKPTKRPLRVGDRVKQGTLLAVVHSRELGRARAAFVDAVIKLRLSQEQFERMRKLFEDGGLPLATLRKAERELQADSDAAFTAERALHMMKLTKTEVQDLRDEARKLGEAMQDKKLVRDPEAEALKWSRAEIRVPRLSEGPEQELTIVEKNACITDIVESGKGRPLLRLADLTKLQIRVEPPEEYLPLIRAGLKKKGGLEWEIRTQADPKAAPLKLPVDRIHPGIEQPAQIAVVGFLPNKDHKYVVGQFVTATILMPPEEGVVFIPSASLTEMGGQTLVFVQPDPARREYVLRRLAVAERFKDVVWVAQPSGRQRSRQDRQEGQANQFTGRAAVAGGARRDPGQRRNDGRPCNSACQGRK